MNKLPLITKNIKLLIDDKFNGNVSQFAFAMGLSNSAKINRLFKIDKRNGEYPIPSTDILMLISNTFDVSIDWLVKGSIEDKAHVNNITIGATTVNGNENITNKSDSEYISIIKKQQEQIDSLLKIIASK